MRGARAALGALATALVLLLAGGCGGEPVEPAEERSYLPGNPRAGAGGGLSQLPEADCAQWRAADVGSRQAAVAELGELFSRGNADSEGYKLPDELAFELIDEACEREYAEAFRLWKIYERALAFQYEAPGS